jgi:hypothetical protein
MHYPDMQPLYYSPCAARVVRCTPLIWDVDIHLALAGLTQGQKTSLRANTRVNQPLAERCNEQSHDRDREEDKIILSNVWRRLQDLQNLALITPAFCFLFLTSGRIYVNLC